MNNDNGRRFTGWMIPVELREKYHLTLNECILWAEIYSRQPSTLPVTYYGKFLGISKEKAKKAMENLKARGLITSIEDDGDTWWSTTNLVKL